MDGAPAILYIASIKSFSLLSFPFYYRGRLTRIFDLGTTDFFNETPFLALATFLFSPSGFLPGSCFSSGPFPSQDPLEFSPSCFFLFSPSGFLSGSCFSSGPFPSQDPLEFSPSGPSPSQDPFEFSPLGFFLFELPGSFWRSCFSSGPFPSPDPFESSPSGFFPFRLRGFFLFRLRGFFWGSCFSSGPFPSPDPSEFSPSGFFMFRLSSCSFPAQNPFEFLPSCFFLFSPSGFFWGSCSSCGPFPSQDPFEFSPAAAVLFLHQTLLSFHPLVSSCLNCLVPSGDHVLALVLFLHQTLLSFHPLDSSCFDLALVLFLHQTLLSFHPLVSSCLNCLVPSGDHVLALLWISWLRARAGRVSKIVQTIKSRHSCRWCRGIASSVGSGRHWRRSSGVKRRHPLMWKETSDLPHTVSQNRNLLVPSFERHQTLESVSCLDWTCSFCYGVVVIQIQGVAVLQPRDSSKAIHSSQPQQGLRMLSGAVLGEYCISSFSTGEER
ncbi:hypothetical protein NC653_030222 [Populus alba x Populus x berolinensis]|uniref:Uncharacterized protein n=1 Tax=Populus alba x Populus x berolinensis TaxID=444605 RepID=A0AAD6LVH1_9ROSI|nr:hypothetical protein NC653_030222 [Populus alba x Populus x berolinensis]